MKILALESSAVACSAALCEDGNLIAQTFQNNGLTHSVTLLPMAASLLEQCGASLEQVEVIAVAAGPGSFTGVRIGVAAAKGLAWPDNKPCAACSTLESMAWGVAHMGMDICAVMDARRNQVYNARFHGAGDGLERLTPDRAIGLDALAEELKNRGKPQILVGDGAVLCYTTCKDGGFLWDSSLKVNEICRKPDETIQRGRMPCRKRKNSCCFWTTAPCTSSGRGTTTPPT